MRDIELEVNLKRSESTSTIETMENLDLSREVYEI